MSEAFGIMDSAYFVNKNDILKWINTTLKVTNPAKDKRVDNTEFSKTIIIFLRICHKKQEI